MSKLHLWTRSDLVNSYYGRGGIREFVLTNPEAEISNWNNSVQFVKSVLGYAVHKKLYQAAPISWGQIIFQEDANGVWRGNCSNGEFHIRDINIAGRGIDDRVPAVVSF